MKHVEYLEHTGFIEHGANLLGEPQLQPELSKFFNYYNLRLQRVYNLEVGTREAMHRWIMESPLYILVCGAPDLTAWWDDFFVFNEDGSYTIDEDAPKDPEKYDGSFT
jgi:hypothetical protein